MNPWHAHKVTEYGRMFFTVTSASRKNLVHFVDFEVEDAPVFCTCEDTHYRKNPICRHVAAVVEWLVEQLNAPDIICDEFREALIQRCMIQNAPLEIFRNDEDILVDEPNRCVIPKRTYKLKAA